MVISKIMLHTGNHVAQITRTTSWTTTGRPQDAQWFTGGQRSRQMQLRVARPARRWPPHADPPAARTGRDPALIAVRRAVGPRTHRTGRSACRQSRGRLSSRPFRVGDLAPSVYVKRLRINCRCDVSILAESWKIMHSCAYMRPGATSSIRMCGKPASMPTDAERVQRASGGRPEFDRYSTGGAVGAHVSSARRRRAAGTSAHRGCAPSAVCCRPPAGI